MAIDSASEARLEIAWQNTVVDILPTSRYGVPGEAPDIAVVTTSVGQLTGDGTQVLQLGSTVPVFPAPDREEGTYRFELRCPEPFAELVKDGDLSVIVLIPRIAERDGTLAEWRVELADWNEKDSATVFRADGGPGRRAGVGWYWKQDPGSIVEYVYRMINR